MTRRGEVRRPGRPHAQFERICSLTLFPATRRWESAGRTACTPCTVADGIERDHAIHFDLHLDASRLHITRLFVDFVRTEAMQANALYILGDLFEA